MSKSDSTNTPHMAERLDGASRAMGEGRHASEREGCAHAPVRSLCVRTVDTTGIKNNANGKVNKAYNVLRGNAHEMRTQPGPKIWAFAPPSCVGQRFDVCRNYPCDSTILPRQGVRHNPKLVKHA